MPSRIRLMWTSSSIVDAICSRIDRIGRSKPDMRAIVSTRASASRGELACSVDREPSWPVFIACIMSSASPPRTSPTMMRSGRMRSALRSRSRVRTSPLPSMFGGPALEPDDVALLQAQLGGVLDRHDALVVGDHRRQHVEQRRLPAAGAAAHEDVGAALDAGAEEVAPPRR